MTAAIALVIVAAIYVPSLFQSTKTKVVFCNVGQGDAAYIRVRNKYDILIDSGPDSSVLSCLGKHMPFYDRTIELAVLSHPDFDHYAGFIPILGRYKIKRFFMAPLTKSAVSYQQLLQEIDSSNTNVYFTEGGDAFNIFDANLAFYWPTEEFLQKSIRYPTETNGLSDFFKKLGTPTRPTNEFSSILIFEQNDFRILFTGDTTAGVLQEVGQYIPFSSDRKVNILKVPHHGSKNGLTYDFLKLADPTLSVISVGKHNRYGHPSKEVLDFFKALGKNYVRTDEKGDIVYWIN